MIRKCLMECLRDVFFSHWLFEFFTAVAAIINYGNTKKKTGVGRMWLCCANLV